MAPSRIIITGFLLFLVCCPTWAETFLIETRTTVTEGDMELEEKLRVIGTESGVMDTLFENGHIFFNVYNAPDENGFYLPLERTMALAEETGADYLLELIPDDLGVTWRFHSVGAQSGRPQEDYEEIAQVDQDLSANEQWIALGGILGQRMMGAIPAR